jgi:MFS transporter, DHA3 family, macrolide efflux protein
MTENVLDKQSRPSGMAGFMVVWIGQIISVLASAMTGFGMTLWMYKQTGSATAMAGMQVAFITPFLILSPIAGVMVDRYNRKLMMMISDLTAVVPTVVILILYATGHLQFWHLYFSAAINGLGNTFQWPAYSAAISTMVPKKHYGRANGLMSLLGAGPGVLAPLLAGIIFSIPMTRPFDSFALIMVIDLVTFFIAIGALLIVHVPQPVKTVEGQKESGSIWKESAYGFKYIFKRPSLLGLQLIFFAGNLFSGIGFTLLAPMILARTAQNSVIFGSVQTAGAVGGVAGGIIMSVWSGLKRKVHGVLIGWGLTGLFFAMLGIGQGLTIWIPFFLVGMVFSALINTSNQAIWQTKVAPDLQGRVFSARRLIAWFTQPIAPMIAGLLADYVMEPAMKSNTALARMFGGLFGTGPGSGMGLLFFFAGIMSAIVGFSGYLFKSIRDVEIILPDHDQLEKLEEIQPAS